MIRTSAKIISLLTHPLLLYFVLIYICYSIDKTSFRFADQRSFNASLILAFFSVVLIPLVGIMVMRGLKLFSSVQMESSKDRIAPLITTSIFYIWFYVNVSKNELFPTSLAMISLGGAIAVCLAFFINNFSKISLHAIGAAGLMTGLGILIFTTANPYIDIYLPYFGGFSISSIFVFICAILMLGLSISSRLLLEAHNYQDSLGGLFVGIFSQLMAFRIYA